MNISSLTSDEYYNYLLKTRTNSDTATGVSAAVSSGGEALPDSFPANVSARTALSSPPPKTDAAVSEPAALQQERFQASVQLQMEAMLQNGGIAYAMANPAAHRE